MQRRSIFGQSVPEKRQQSWKHLSHAEKSPDWQRPYRTQGVCRLRGVMQEPNGYGAWLLPADHVDDDAEDDDDDELPRRSS